MPSLTPLLSTAQRSAIPLIALAFCLAAAVAGAGLWYTNYGRVPTPPPLVDLEAEVGPAPALSLATWLPTTADLAVSPAATAKHVTVNRGDTLMALLVDAGAERRDAHKAIRALSKVFSPRELKPGQAIRLTFAATAPAAGGNAPPLVSMSLQPSADLEVHVARQGPDNGFLASTIDRPLGRVLSAGAGTIVSSLFIAGREANVPGPIMIELIRAFSFDVDFQREIQTDDRFEVLYEGFTDVNGELVKTGDILFAGLILSGRRIDLYRFTPGSGRTDFFGPDGQSVRKTLMRTPIDGARISSGYGRRRHPVLGYNKMHRGTDFAAPRGTPVYAAGDGVIERANRFGAFGNYVRIRHNGTYKTAYAHLKGFAKGIRGGTRVRQGQVIAYVGTSGRSTGPHLHYEVHINGKQANPLKINLPSGERLKGGDLEAFQAARAEIERLYREALNSTLIADVRCQGDGATEDTSTEAPAPAGGSC